MRPSSTAIHEAGHAVVAYILGYKVTDIVVQPDKTGYCNVVFRVPWRRECSINQANILLAGYEAEVLWCRRRITSIPDSDLRMLKRLGVSWTGINIQRAQLKRFLKKWRATVWMVARMLDLTGRVTGRRFHSFMRTRCSWRPPRPVMCR